MAEENPKEEERRSARGRRAKKLEEDVLEPILEGNEQAVELPGEQPAQEASDEAKEAVVSQEAPAADETSEEEEEAVEESPEEAAEEASLAPEESSETTASAASEESKEDSGAEPVDEGREEEKPEPLTPEEVISQGEAWLGELFEKMELELKAEGRADGDNFVFNISGSDGEALIGRSRQSPRVLAAMQTILTEKLGRRLSGQLEVDLGGFKQRRQGRLAELATKLGNTARRLERPLTIAGLNNFERRVIHQELADERGLRTESTDQGIFRKLRILPK